MVGYGGQTIVICGVCIWGHYRIIIGTEGGVPPDSLGNDAESLARGLGGGPSFSFATVKELCGHTFPLISKVRWS